MQDLTTGSLTRHLLKTTSFMLVTMVFQTLYFLVDLYWVGRLGKEAVAGVGIAGNLNFITLAVTQMLSVGITTLVSHATGQKDRDRALVVFNQSQVLSVIVGLLFFLVGIATRTVYVNALGADSVTAGLASDYLLWFIPAMSLQFGMVAMGAALRGTGNFRPGMIVSTASVILNMVLAPFLIFGWVTHRPYGVTGAAISTLVAVAVATVWLTGYFLTKRSYLQFMPSAWKPDWSLWKKMLGIGLPAGAEFALLAVYLVIVYIVSRPFGSGAQAGFGIGMRIVQAGFMPVVALGFSVAPVAGQNFGARQPARVRATFRSAALMAAGAMVMFTAVCQVAAAPMVRVFSSDPQVIDVGAGYLHIVSWTFAASGIIFVGSSMFQALGHTLPALIASFCRIVLVAIPVFVLSHAPGFQLRWIWYISVAALVVQLAVNQLLLFREFGRRLTFAPPAAV
jgi:putative MATE family efflux protein